MMTTMTFLPDLGRELPEMRTISPSSISPEVQIRQCHAWSKNPVENLRELVHKYGQSQTISSPRNWQDKSGVTIQPWNDDDDDIPEWQPHAPQNQFPQQPDFQLQGHMANQSYVMSQKQQQRMLPMQSLQSPVNVNQRNTGPMWVSTTQSNNKQPSNINYGVPTTQGIAWRQNDPRSRGF